MNDSNLQLTDLPDEILLLIFKNLTNIEVFYSLLHVNKRFHDLAKDSIFTRHLTLLTHSSNGVKSTISSAMLNRLHTQVLPIIHSDIRWLTLEPSSMKGIIVAVNYPNLQELTLLHIERETDLSILAGKFQ